MVMTGKWYVKAIVIGLEAHDEERQSEAAKECPGPDVPNHECQQEMLEVRSLYYLLKDSVWESSIIDERRRRRDKHTLGSLDKDSSPLCIMTHRSLHSSLAFFFRFVFVWGFPLSSVLSLPFSLVLSL